MPTAPTLEQRILEAAKNSDDLDDLLDEAEGTLPAEQLDMLLDKIWLISYEQCLEVNGWSKQP
jgi:hypothetical protein